MDSVRSVSYTHLDVYKRQIRSHSSSPKRFLKIFGIRVGLDECERILQKAYAEVDCEFVCVGTDDHLQIYTTDQVCAQTVAELLADRLHISNRAVQAYYIAEIPKNASGKTQYSKLQGEVKK